jgi:hypothetical protein
MRSHPPAPAERPAQTGLERDLVSACCETATEINAHLEVAGQRNARGSGTTVGAPDATLFCSGNVVPIEFKRRGRIASDDGQLSLAQRARIYDRYQQGIPTAVIFSEAEFIRLINWCRRNARPRWTVPFAGSPS